MPYQNGQVVGWKHTIKIKHLFTQSEERDDIVESMTKIADVLEKKDCVKDFFYLGRCRKINDVRTANAFLDKLYDFCDARLIWVE